METKRNRKSKSMDQSVLQLWKGGGVTHGPRNDRIFEKEIPKKMRRKALFMVLSEKAKNKQLIVLDKIELEKGKTKEMAKSLIKITMQQTGNIDCIAKL